MNPFTYQFVATLPRTRPAMTRPSEACKRIQRRDRGSFTGVRSKPDPTPAGNEHRNKRMNELARLLILGGIVLIAAGVLCYLVGLSAGGPLPGDIFLQRKNVIIVFPLATCVVISIVLTIVLNLFGRR